MPAFVRYVLDAVLSHPVAGSSWEGFVLDQLVNAAPHAQASFYRTSNGAEVDLVLYATGYDRDFPFIDPALPAQGMGDAQVIWIGIGIGAAGLFLRQPQGFVDLVFAVLRVHAATPMRGVRRSRNVFRLRNRWLLMVPSASPVIAAISPIGSSSR